MEFWPAPQPLVERLGVDFFRGLPRHPGVYWMASSDGRVLYVGKARDLRARLDAYRRLDSHVPRIRRMISRAAHVRWERCATEADSLSREAELIRIYRPQFNRAGKGMGGGPHVGVIRRGGGLDLWLGRRMGPAGEEGPEFTGRFRWAARDGFLALGRLLTWTHPSRKPGNEGVTAPRPKPGPGGSLRWMLPEPAGEWWGEVTAALEGAPMPLLTRLAQRSPSSGSAFAVVWWQAEWDRLASALGVEDADAPSNSPGS